MRRGISDALAAELTKRFESLEAEQKYFESFTRETEAGLSASGLEEDLGAKDRTDQRGTSVPRYFGAANTFISNPSNVGIGVLARMIETDPTCSSAVQFKSLMMLAKIGEYQHKNPKIEEFVRRFLARMQGPTWKQAQEAMSSHGGYGFSISEIIWGINKENQKVPIKIKTYHPSTIVFEVDGNGDVTEDGIVQFTMQFTEFSNPNMYFPRISSGFLPKNPFETPVDRLMPYRMPFINNFGIVRIPKNKVIHHVANTMLSFGSPYGKTAVRSAHLSWQLKVYVLKHLGIAAKRQAAPFIWGTAPFNQNQVKTVGDGASKQMNPVEALTDLLARREGDDSIVTGSETMGYKIQAIAQQMDLTQYLQVLQWLDTQMFRAFLLPSLVMSEGTAGSRALGDKHFQIVDRIAEEEALTFSQTNINQMIRPAIDQNFGEQDDYGSFAQRPQSIEERTALGNMYASLISGNAMDPKNKEDNDFIRSTLHIPKADESFYTAAMPDMTGTDIEDDDSEEIEPNDPPDEAS